MVTFILGGCRSGKSRFALDAAQQVTADRRIFIATAVAFDDEMRDRVRRHQAERGPEWATVEAPVRLAEAVDAHGRRPGNVILVDCLTFWVNNLLMESAEASPARDRIPQLIAAVEGSRCPVILVSNEVGAGIVPENRLARRFRDIVGSLNQAAAACAAEVVWVVAGIPVRIKTRVDKAA